jgi:hypothetical protein
LAVLADIEQDPALNGIHLHYQQFSGAAAARYYLRGEAHARIGAIQLHREPQTQRVEE